MIPLWPDGAPGSEDWTQKEQEAIFQPDIKVVRNIVQPTMTAYLPDPSLANGTAVIVCPGGACHFLSIDLERTDVARWLNSRAIAAFALKYPLHETSDNFAREMMENLTNPESIDAVLKELRPFLIADGLGGDVSSDFAAEIAKGKLAGLKRLTNGKEKQELGLFAKEPDLIISKKVKTYPEFEGMATTLVCAIF